MNDEGALVALGASDTALAVLVARMSSVLEAAREMKEAMRAVRSTVSLRLSMETAMLAQGEAVASLQETYGAANLLADEAGRVWSHRAVYDPAADLFQRLLPADRKSVV